jgi:hypothetical protein
LGVMPRFMHGIHHDSSESVIRLGQTIDL